MPPKKVIKKKTKQVKKTKPEEEGENDPQDEGVSEELTTHGAPQVPIGGQCPSARGKSPEIVSEQQEDAANAEDAAFDEGQDDQKKARAKSVLLDPEQEQVLIAWLKNHSELYDTHKNDFTEH